MQTIEAQTKAFAEARDVLAERVSALRSDLESLKRARLRGIRGSLGVVKDAHDKLKASLEASQPLFEKPKTRILHGIKVGYVKQPGRMEVLDPIDCVARIKKQLGDAAKDCIKVTETPVLKALGQRSAAELKKLGITVTADTDIVVIKPADADLDKLISALINDKDLEEVAT